MKFSNHRYKNIIKFICKASQKQKRHFRVFFMYSKGL